ncbi:hypothetical protein EVAR_20562_1 [Eumeta japonica]|uniref:Uncharacterized protein n=1 Tax=Eumeta variegata TaxID=151549 RepID=A0A4C1USJ6_EUMVA|nr:hypothetical protein EVAR_20562_1 [Eumeta japonica]
MKIVRLFGLSTHSPKHRQVCPMRLGNFFESTQSRVRRTLNYIRAGPVSIDRSCVRPECGVATRRAGCVTRRRDVPTRGAAPT